MSACKALNFTGVTPDVWSCIKDAVKSKTGITIDTNTGKASKWGFTVTWDYEPDAETLTIQCVDSPPLPTCSTINGAILSVGRGCGANGPDIADEDDATP